MNYRPASQNKSASGVDLIDEIGSLTVEMQTRGVLPLCSGLLPAPEICEVHLFPPNFFTDRHRWAMHNEQNWQLVRRYQCPTCQKSYAVPEWNENPKCRQCGAGLRPADSQAKPTPESRITMRNTNARTRRPSQSESVPELSRESLSNFAAASLALGWTHCKTANLTDCPEKRHHLLILAREALRTAETCMGLASPETFTDALEEAGRLRSQIAQLEKEFGIQNLEPLTARPYSRYASTDAFATAAFPPRPVRDQGHVVQFYTDDTHLLDSLCTLFADTLSEGESVVAVLTKSHRSGVEKRLIAEGIDMSGATKNGRLTILDADQALSEFIEADRPNRGRFLLLFGRTIRRAEAAALAKNRRVVVFGEMVAVLWAQKKFNAAIRLEQLWNELVLTHSFYLCCAYPASEFHGTWMAEPYAEICARHSEVVVAF